MDQNEVANLIGRLETEARYAAELLDQARNRFERASDGTGEEREYLHVQAQALNSLGNIRLAQALHRQQNGNA